MQQRSFGSSQQSVSEIGLGCWQLGADWGTVDEDEAMQILETAVEKRVTFLDTADVYGDGRSERLVGRLLADLGSERAEDLMIATKVGRKNYPGPYTRDVLRTHVEQGRERLGVDTVDLVQTHCLPTDVMRTGEVFEWLREFKKEGLIRNFGASVESVDEALMIVDQPGLTSLQVIFNIFRQKPAKLLFDEAMRRNIGIVVRLPLASGLLSGKFTHNTTFAEDDHRNYNKNGEAFNVGETFAGLPFDVGVDLANRIKRLVPPTMSMAQFSQRWILDHPAVSTVITGASSPVQVNDNVVVSDLQPLDAQLHRQLAAIYEDSIHARIRGTY